MYSYILTTRLDDMGCTCKKTFLAITVIIVFNGLFPSRVCSKAISVSREFKISSQRCKVHKPITINIGTHARLNGCNFMLYL